MTRVCPKCRRRELPPRCRVCEECLKRPVQASQPVQRLEQKPRPGAVVSQLLAVPPRSLDLYCSCRVVLGGGWWPGDDYECKTHGPTWVARVTRDREIR